MFVFNEKAMAFIKDIIKEEYLQTNIEDMLSVLNDEENKDPTVWFQFYPYEIKGNFNLKFMVVREQHLEETHDPEIINKYNLPIVEFL